MSLKWKVKQEKNTKAWLVAVNTMVMACSSQGTTQNPENPGMEPTPTESGHYRNLCECYADMRRMWNMRLKEMLTEGCFNFQHQRTRDSHANSIRGSVDCCWAPPIFHCPPFFLTSVDQVENKCLDEKNPELCLGNCGFFMKWSYSGLTWIAAAAGWGRDYIYM